MESALMRRLATVPDQRSSCGLRHPLVVIVTLTACATPVVGGDSVAAIRQWAARISQQVLQRLGAYRDSFTGLFTVPSERTFRRVLAELDADALGTAISGYVVDVIHHQAPAPQIPDTPGPAEREQRRAAARQLTHPAPPGLLPAAALDGKALRGARTAEGGRVVLVGAISHEHGVILGQCQVASKKGEGPAARTLLPHLPIEGMVLTLDALHTTKTTARMITQMGGHYVLIVKGNQPLTRAAAHALLSEPDAEWSATTAIDDDHGHGRTERRTIRTAPADDGLFPGARQAFRLRRDVGDLARPPDGPWISKEIVFGIASLPGRSHPPQPLRALHWCVENRLNGVRDVTFKEDHSQVRTGTAPRALASFRNLAISTARLVAVPTSPPPAATSSTTMPPSLSTTSDHRTDWDGTIQRRGPGGHPKTIRSVGRINDAETPPELRLSANS
ncbi:ISAs1 family transposase [Streptosporangium lutulentum]